MNLRVNERNIDCSGTSLVGYISTKYSTLVSVLGETEICDDGKTRAEWNIEGEVDGEKVVATIYDWKEFIPVENVTEWHIGGFDSKALSLIRALFGSNVRKY